MNKHTMIFITEKLFLSLRRILFVSLMIKVMVQCSERIVVQSFISNILDLHRLKENICKFVSTSLTIEAIAERFVECDLSWTEISEWCTLSWHSSRTQLKRLFFYSSVKSDEVREFGIGLVIVWIAFLNGRNRWLLWVTTFQICHGIFWQLLST